MNLQYKFDQDPSDGFMNLMDFDQTKKARRLISLAWTDLQNPGCGKNSSEYVYQDLGLISGTEQAYTFYFLPMVYTVAEGHHLELILTTWDPYRVQLDAWFNLDGSLETQLDEDTYSYNMTINNGSLELILPTGTGDPDWLQPEALFQGRDKKTSLRPQGKEIKKIMKNNTNELNMKATTKREISMDELEQVCGGGAVHTAAKKKALRKIIDWIWSWFE